MSASLAKRAIKSMVPQQYRFAVRSAGYRLLYAGDNRYCPCCASTVRSFKDFGPVTPRPNAQCPVCGALERDRLVAHYFERHPRLLAQADRVLHVSPERPIAHLLQSRGGIRYVSIDIEPGLAMEVEDLTALPYAEDSFDAVYCSNVLEHIREDHTAMQQISRVLCPSGWAIILVPLYGDATHEDRSVTSPEERTRLYGQPDHVRAYGIDIAERLAAAGLDVWVEQPAIGFSEEEALRQGVDPNEIIFCCRKPRPGDRRDDRPTAPNFVPAFGHQPALRNRYAAAYQVNPDLIAAWEQGTAAAAR